MTAPLWTREALEAATGASARGEWNAVTGVSIDSRSVEPGDLFVALKDQRDGHAFVADALKAGAGAALVSRVPEGCGEAALLVSEDALYALEGIGAAARDRMRGRAIAVTGSAGKTSVKEALRHVLGAQAPTHASERSYNNHWGVPLTLARMPEGTAYGVFEIGMNHAGEIRPLTKLARPHVAIVTTVAPAHLGNFASEREIAQAKAEIVEGLVPGGLAIVNRDIPWFDLIAGRAAAQGARVMGFGQHEAAEARLLTLSQSSKGAAVEAVIGGVPVLFRLAVAGRHHAMNALAVLAAAQAVGADLAKAALALADWRPGDGRGAVQSLRLDAVDPASAILLIDESYNANPASMRAALETLSLAETGVGVAGRRGRRIAVIGDMLELGAGADDLHAGLAEAPEMGSVDLVFTCGAHSRALHEALPTGRRGGWAADSAALATVVAQAVRPGDAVMVKGSLGSAMARVVAALKALPHARRRA